MNTILKYIKINNINIQRVSCFILMTFIYLSLSAKEKAGSIVPQNDSSDILIYIGLGVIVVLFLVIFAFAFMLVAASKHANDNEPKITNKASAILIKSILLLMAFGLSSSSLMAQDEVAPVIVEANKSMGGFTFYAMLSVIVFELIVIWILYSFSMKFFRIKDKILLGDKAMVKKKKPTMMEKLNASVDIEHEADIMLDHDYDGIKELDNDLPPWWKYGFYFSILVSIIYMIHFHVTKTGKLQLEEYEDQIVQSKIDLENYYKNSANLIDESNVTLLTDETSINSGKKIYAENCAACHGMKGEGVVGPNLTDEYWIHSGGIKDVFKIVKFGKPEKGMKSWQQDLSAKKMQEVSSYILTLQGTNPPNAKEKQGDLYTP